jgi:tRNA (guanine37-N1)-methyltransferase
MFCAILTLFPGAVRPYLDESILGIAQRQGKLQIQLIDWRDFTSDRHRTVDDRPFGGGPGMVLKPEPIFAAVEDAERRFGPFHKVLLCPRGRRLDQSKAKALAKVERLLLLCGRYEGFDERIRLGFDWDEISLGDFVLAGGELAALCVVEAAVRLIPGVLGCAQSPEQESFENGMIEHPQYTRPRSFRGMDVPEILISGDHAAVDRWRLSESRRITEFRRRLHLDDSPAEAPFGDGIDAIETSRDADRGDLSPESEPT